MISKPDLLNKHVAALGFYGVGCCWPLFRDMPMRQLVSHLDLITLQPRVQRQRLGAPAPNQLWFDKLPTSHWNNLSILARRDVSRGLDAQRINSKSQTILKFVWLIKWNRSLAVLHKPVKFF